MTALYAYILGAFVMALGFVPRGRSNSRRRGSRISHPVLLMAGLTIIVVTAVQSQGR